MTVRCRVLLPVQPDRSYRQGELVELDDAQAAELIEISFVERAEEPASGKQSPTPSEGSTGVRGRARRRLGGGCRPTVSRVRADVRHASVDDLRARFDTDELEQVLGDGNARALTALDDAGAEIDAALAEIYTLPLRAGTWPALVGIACDIARARLYDHGAPERVLGRLSSARKRLRMLGSGETRLVDAAEQVSSRENLRDYLEPSRSHGVGYRP